MKYICKRRINAVLVLYTPLGYVVNNVRVVLLPPQLGDPMAALFVVGNFKRHPDVPETMSAAAKCFCEKYVCTHNQPLAFCTKC